MKLQVDTGACRIPETPWTSCNKGSRRSPRDGIARNARFAVKAIQHNADLFLGRILLAGRPTDVLHKPLGRQCLGSGFLSHLHSLAITMSQKSSAIQYPQSVS